MLSGHCNQPKQFRQMTLALLCFLSVGAAAWADSDAGRVIDRSVALLEGRVLTLSELEFEARVLLIFSGAGAAAATQPLDDEALRASLEVVINNRLESNEADKLSAYPLDDSEVDTAMSSFRRRFASEREYGEFLA